MIRIIIRETNYADAAHVGGPVLESFKTFDVELPQVESYLAEELKWGSRRVIGIEAVAAKAKTQPRVTGEQE